MMSDPLVQLKRDHKKIRELFRDFDGARDTRLRLELVQRIIEEIAAHAYLESAIVYPSLRAALPALEDEIIAADAQNEAAEILCRELSGLAPEADLFDAKVAVLMDIVRDHISETESHWFPEVRRGLDRSTVIQIGERIDAARLHAPGVRRVPTYADGTQRSIGPANSVSSAARPTNRVAPDSVVAEAEGDLHEQTS